MGWGGRGTYFLIIFYDNKTRNLCQRFCQKDPILPGGSQRGGLDLGGCELGSFEGNVVGCEGRLCRASAPAGPLENVGLGPGCAISTLQESNCCPVLVLLYPQLPRGASWSDQTLTFQGLAHEGRWPTDRNSDRCLNKQGSKLFKHFRSKIFKLFCVKYVVSQDWEFIFSFVYYMLQKQWYSP